jgi:hypothetical protein
MLGWQRARRRITRAIPFLSSIAASMTISLDANLERLRSPAENGNTDRRFFREIRAIAPHIARLASSGGVPRRFCPRRERRLKNP